MDNELTTSSAGSPLDGRVKPRFTRHGRKYNQTHILLRHSGMVRRMLSQLPEPSSPSKEEAIVKVADRVSRGTVPASELIRAWGQDALTRLHQSHCTTGAGRPKCGACPVRKLCINYRRRAQARHSIEPDAPRIAEFFAGAGGMSLGFEQAGFEPVLAVDIDQDAMHTYHANRPHLPESAVQCADMQEFLTEYGVTSKARQLLSGLDGIVGGPPCQTFSLVGFRSKGLDDPNERIKEDRRTWLPIAMARVVAATKPKFTVMENVAAFYSALGGSVREEVVNILEAAGYSIAEAKVWAHKNGAPQRRARYILIGIRAYGSGGSLMAELKAEKIKQQLESGTMQGNTVRQALRELQAFPTVPRGGGSEYVRGERGRETWNHYARPHNDRDLAIYAKLKPGQTARQLVAEHGPGAVPYRVDSFGDKYRKLDPDDFSPTIPAHLKKDANSFVLDGVNRGVTPREAATLQGFPCDYIFLGSQSHQFQQIGNAVAPPVAHAIASAIRRELEL